MIDIFNSKHCVVNLTNFNINTENHNRRWKKSQRKLSVASLLSVIIDLALLSDTVVSFNGWMQAGFSDVRDVDDVVCTHTAPVQ